MEDGYFVLSGNEDGEVYFYRMSKTALLKALDEGDWGKDVQFLRSAPSNLAEMGKGLLIIKGEIVVPRPEQEVVKHAID